MRTMPVCAILSNLSQICIYLLISHENWLCQLQGSINYPELPFSFDQTNNSSDSAHMDVLLCYVFVKHGNLAASINPIWEITIGNACKIECHRIFKVGSEFRSHG